MSAFYDLASLVVVPSGYKASKVYAQKPLTTDGQLTFSRSTGATRVNSAGLIEKVRTNLLFPSNNWVTLTASGSATNNTTANPIDGAVTAGTLTGAGFWGKNVSASGIHTMSVYVKAGTVNAARLNIYNGSTDIGVTFNLTTGASSSEYGTIVNKGAVNAGNGWWRLYLSVNCTSALYAQLHVDSAGTVFAYALQGETGDIATDYIATTSAAVSVGPVANVPRLDYLNSSCPRLLLEPQRTNSQRASEQINNASYWSAGGGSVSSNLSVSPDGYQNADKFVESAATERHELYSDSLAFSGTSSVSIFAKASGRRYFSAITGGDPTLGGATFDLQTGVVSATSGGTTASITPYGNGWYRCTFTTTRTNTSQVYFCLRTSGGAPTVETYAGDGTSGILFWGCQVELAGAYATSYIPTLGAAVTRGADACSKTGISSLIGSTEGVLYAEVDVKLLQQAGRILLDVNDNNTTNRALLALNGSAVEGFVQGSPRVAYTLPSAGVYKFAFAYKSGDFALYVNGVQRSTSTDAITFSGMNQLFLGHTFNINNTQPVDVIKSALLFKTRLPNAQLAELTSL